MKPAAMKDGKLYSQQPHSGAGDFNFSRADGVQTRINKHGLIETVANNEPRLSYDLVDGKVSDCPHLLLEPSRTNFGKYSEEISSWTELRIITSDNQAISPDGSQNASKTTATATFGSHAPYIDLSSTVTSGSNYVMSIFVKKSTTKYIRFTEGYSNYGLIFNFDTEEITENGNASSSDIGVEKYPNDWYRLYVKFVGSSTTNSQPALYLRRDVDSAESYTGTDEAVFIWGLQVEAGTYHSSYVKNASFGTTIRSADICNGSGNSETFNDSEGVLFAEFSALANDGTTRVITINDTSNQLTERVQLFILGASMYGRVTDGGVTQGQVIGTPTLTDNNKIAFKYKVNNFALWINGFEVDTSNLGSTPSGLDTIRFDAGTGGSSFYGKVKELTVFNEALTDEQLQLLTTP